ncbi:MAG: phosphonate ABC transporter, permease protein PhnE, partial [Alphaproteobacteria bacterium]
LTRALRDGLVVGLVGAGGIGGPLFDAIAAGALREVSALALAALAALLVVEAAGRRLARRLG